MIDPQTLFKLNKLTLVTMITMVKMIIKVTPAEDWGENGVGNWVECHRHPVGHPPTLSEDHGWGGGQWWWWYWKCLSQLTYSWLLRVFTALKELYAGQSVPRNSQACKHRHHLCCPHYPHHQHVCFHTKSVVLANKQCSKNLFISYVCSSHQHIGMIILTR